MPDVTPIPKVNVRGRRSPSAATLKRKATTLHSAYVRARDGRCVRCGSTTGQLQCMHVFSRRYAATRSDERNGHTGCAACHRWLGENPLEHVTFFRQYLGDEVFFALKDKAYAGVGARSSKAFWQAEVERLAELLERLR